MKKKKDNIIHDIKIYNIIMSNVWKLITFLFLGVLGGFLLGVLLTNYYISLNKPTNMINYKRGGKCDETEIETVS